MLELDPPNFSKQTDEAIAKIQAENVVLKSQLMSMQEDVERARQTQRAQQAPPAAAIATTSSSEHPDPQPAEAEAASSGDDAPRVRVKRERALDGLAALAAASAT